MPDLTLGGIALVPVIVALVELAKRYGLKDDYAPLANGVLCVLAYIAVVYARGNPTFETYATMAVQAILVFLANAGFYHVAVKPFRR